MSRPPGQPHASPPPPEESIPPRLAEDLSALFSAPRVPAEVDSAILNAARAHQAKAARSILFSRHRRLLRWAGAGAAAAAAVAAVFLGIIRHHPAVRQPSSVAVAPSAPSTPPASHPALAGDIDGNGRIDILDAFTVARALADPNRTGPLPAAWDVNGDGVVDQKDVEWLASAAVRVGGLADRDRGRPADVFDLAKNLGSLEAAGHAPPKASRLAHLNAGSNRGFGKGAGQ